MTRSLTSVALLVHDYDEAIAFFTTAMRFALLEDVPLGEGKRWVRVAPAGGGGAALVLAQAVTPQQQACVGRQGGGRVMFFLETQDFAADHAHLLAHGVRFREAPRHEAYGTVAVFEDRWGNPWDLIGRPMVVEKEPPVSVAASLRGILPAPRRAARARKMDAGIAQADRGNVAQNWIESSPVAN